MMVRVIAVIGWDGGEPERCNNQAPGEEELEDAADAGAWSRSAARGEVFPHAASSRGWRRSSATSLTSALSCHGTQWWVQARQPWVPHSMQRSCAEVGAPGNTPSFTCLTEGLFP